MVKPVKNYNKKELLVTVEHVGRIPPLYQDGPILHPLRVSTQIALKLVSANYPVFEHDPNHLQEKVRLNLLNVMADNFEPYVPEMKPTTPDTGDEVEEIKSSVIPPLDNGDGDPDPDPELQPDPVGETDETGTTEETPEPSEPEKEPESIPEEPQSATSMGAAGGIEVVEPVVTQAKNIPLSQQAAELGIDTTGMSRNKIRKAIEEARKALEEGADA